MKNPEFSTKAKVWLYSGKAAWHFVSLPAKLSKEVKEMFGSMKRGWGSLPVEVTIGKTMWSTSIFPDTSRNCYLLPLKADIRKKENIKNNDILHLSIKIKL